ncbi:hypothetical protein ACH5RR_018221 [Cinchona calisaya]|uniref:Uncharacterized protein n=1 Tax=Cinchona calisaya TaxID=153742 RepID=A0ABD2ZNP5_9GENT
MENRAFMLSGSPIDVDMMKKEVAYAGTIPVEVLSMLFQYQNLVPYPSFEHGTAGLIFEHALIHRPRTPPLELSFQVLLSDNSAVMDNIKGDCEGGGNDGEGG